MTDKFAEFLKIASQLNKMGIVPLLVRTGRRGILIFMFMVMNVAGKHQMKSAFMIWIRLSP